MATRDELHRLVSLLPEEALTTAQAALTHFQTWPPPELVEMEQAAGDMERRMHEQIARMREGSGGGGGVGSFSLGMGSSSADRRNRQAGPVQFRLRARRRVGAPVGHHATTRTSSPWSSGSRRTIGRSRLRSN